MALFTAARFAAAGGFGLGFCGRRAPGKQPYIANAQGPNNQDGDLCGSRRAIGFSFEDEELWACDQGRRRDYEKRSGNQGRAQASFSVSRRCGRMRRKRRRSVFGGSARRPVVSPM